MQIQDSNINIVDAPRTLLQLLDQSIRISRIVSHKYDRSVQPLLKPFARRLSQARQFKPLSGGVRSSVGEAGQVVTPLVACHWEVYRWLVLAAVS